jgi:hypothetical protein
VNAEVAYVDDAEEYVGVDLGHQESVFVNAV